MKYYEILYIVHPALEAGHLKDIIDSIDTLIEKNNGTLLRQDNWGKKKLAYPIDKQNYGTYVLTQFSSEKINSDLLTQLEQNSSILAYLKSRIEENDLLEKIDNISKSESSSDEPEASSTKDVKSDEPEASSTEDVKSDELEASSEDENNKKEI